jgi:hypothetical protein
MSVLPMRPPEALLENGAAAFPCSHSADGVVEISLLLPTDWALALVELSKKRQESVGQMLRSLIERTYIHRDLSH